MIDNCTIEVNGKYYQVDFSKPIDISLPLKEGEENPNCYWAASPVFETVRVGDFVGSVAEGGPVNYQQLTLTPHGNGTHTEGAAHIQKEMSATVNNSLKKFIFICSVITITPEIMENGDSVITPGILKNALGEVAAEAVAIRTLPNTPDKKTRKYSGTNPPYFAAEAISYLVESGITQLLTDLPSIDKEEDGGELQGHRAFWYPKGSLRENCTITELIYVDEAVKDGLYLLNLQICSLETDASPSKPILYYLHNK